MPLSIQSNVSNVKIKVFFSEIIEYLSIINILADIKHHDFTKEFGNKIIQSVSEDDRKFLKLISELPFQGIEFFELLLDVQVFNDFNKFIQIISSYDDIQFIYNLTGQQLEIKKIKLMLNDKNEFDKFISEMTWVYRGSSNVYQQIIYETSTFKNKFISILKNLKNSELNVQINLLKNVYANSIDEINNKLEKLSPLELGSEIMNRSIEPDDDIKEYLFAPSYFISPHYVMAYNKYSRLFLYDIHANKLQNNSYKTDQMITSLKIISDKTRIEILRLLILQPTYGKILANRLNLTTATISHHLELLKSINLVFETRNKNVKYFSANQDEIDKLLNELKNYLYNAANNTIGNNFL